MMMIDVLGQIYLALDDDDDDDDWCFTATLRTIWRIFLIFNMLFEVAAQHLVNIIVLMLVRYETFLT